MREVVNLDEVLASFEERWSPRIVAAINDYDVRTTLRAPRHRCRRRDDRHRQPVVGRRPVSSGP